MAEIKIEKKKPIWPWILAGLLFLAIILYFFVFKDKNNEELINDVSDTTSMANESLVENDDAVVEYINFIDGDSAKMSLDHEYSHEALNKLANATEAIAAKAGVDVKANIDEVRNLSQEITDDPAATNHSDKIGQASTIIATALATIQQSKFPDLNNDSEKLMNDAKAVDENDLTLDQKSTVKTFYSSAAELLQKMNTGY